MERTYCWKTYEQMQKILETVININDRIDITDEEYDALEIAAQCITDIMSRMKNDRPIEWD